MYHDIIVVNVNSILLLCKVQLILIKQPNSFCSGICQSAALIHSENEQNHIISFCHIDGLVSGMAGYLNGSLFILLTYISLFPAFRRRSLTCKLSTEVSNLLVYGFFFVDRFVLEFLP